MKESETIKDLFAFLTIEPNTVVGAYHPQAMPVNLTAPNDIEQWMKTSTPEALLLQRKLPANALKVVASGAKKDGAVAPM